MSCHHRVQTVGCGVDQKVLQAVDQQAQREGVSRSELVRRAIRSYLEGSESRKEIISREYHRSS